MTRPPFRFWRYILLTPVLGAVGLSVLWALGFASFFITVLAMSPAQTSFKTDGVVVLTGGSDRIKTGLELLQAGQTRELLISGVNRSTVLRDLIRKSGLAQKNISCCITLGFEATDTVGNAQETADWVRDNNIRTLRLVTANYHMPRALIEMKRWVPGVRLLPHPVRPEQFTPWTRHGSLLTLTEYNKTLLALARFSIEKLQQIL